MDWLNQRADGAALSLHIVPGARKTEVDGIHGDALKIRLQAPPVDGKANKALVEFLAEKLGIAKSAVSLIRGETSRAKTVLVRGIPCDRIRHLLKPRFTDTPTNTHE